MNPCSISFRPLVRRVGVGSAIVGTCLLAFTESAAATGNTATPATATAAADNSSAFGTSSQALTPKAVAVGYQAQAGSSTSPSGLTGEVAIGASSQAVGQKAIAVGSSATATGSSTIAIGAYAQAGGGEARQAVAIGYNALANGKYSVAVGYGNISSGQSAVSFGRRNQGTFMDAVALGYFNLAYEYQAAAVGFQNTASGNKSTAFGHHTIAQGKYSMAFGARSIATDENSLVLGMLSSAGGLGSLAAGYQTETTGEGATAVGFENHSLDKSASSFGRENVADGLASTALGYKNTTGADYATAIGSNITNNTANSVMIGSSDTAKITILSTGNVGIGTTTPATALDVAGVVRNQGVQVTNLTSATLLGTDASGNLQPVAASALTLTNSQVTSALGYTPVAPTGGTLSGNLTVPAVAVTGGLTTGGNVGIGTTGPIAPLSVVGDFRSTILSEANYTFRGIQISPQNSLSQFHVIRGWGNVGLSLQNNPTITGNIATRVDVASGYAAISTSPDNGATASAERLRVTGAGNVGIGTAAPKTKLHVSLDGSAPAAALYNTSSDNLLLSNSGGGSNARVLTAEAAVGNGSAVTLLKARGTLASPTIVQSGDNLGLINAQGYDGSARQDAAAIRFYVDGAPGAGDMPGGIALQTVLDGTTTLTDRLTVTNAGNVGIGTSSPATMLDVAGVVRNQGVQVSNLASAPLLGTDASGNLQPVAASSLTITGAQVTAALGYTPIDPGTGGTMTGNLTAPSVALSGNLTAAGSIGVGTSTPSAPLEVAVNNLSTNVTSATGLLLNNSTPATAGTTVQYSPTLSLAGSRWTTDLSASQPSNWIVQNRPGTGTSGTGNKSSLVFAYSSGGSYANAMSLSTDANLTGLSVVRSATFTSSGSNAGLTLNSQDFSTANLTAVTTVGGTVTNSSGKFTGVNIRPTYNQTGTAAATDLQINRTETAVGSGAQYLIDAQVGGVSRFNVTNGGQGYFLGNVGIGITTPASPLDISASARPTNGWIVKMLYSGLTTTSGSNSIGYALGRDASNYNLASIDYNYKGANSTSNYVSFGMYGLATPPLNYNGAGNVGIGTTTPTQKLDVVGVIRNQGVQVTTLPSAALLGTDASGNIQSVAASSLTLTNAQVTTALGYAPIGPSGGTLTGNLTASTVTATDTLSAAGNAAIGDTASSSGPRLLVKGLGTTSATSSVAVQDSSGASLLQISDNGNVGIGTTNPTQKLAVNGTIRAKEVLVESTGWSDYVFASDYRLAPLSEVEEHIKAHGHLPGIPSAGEVESHGVNVGEMQAKLLAKIEELTLRQIAQEKEISKVSSENAELRAMVRQLKADTSSSSDIR